ncbi:MAG TPA: TonB family protein [Thermoanaerobaculia bacterium]|nr:TonB family protein [Thermoanaerobaculia bacterium]
MFEPAPAARRRPMFAVSAAAHAALAAALIVPPLFATPEPPEPDGYVHIEHLPPLTSDAPDRIQVDSLRRVRKGGPSARASRSGEAGARTPPRPRPVQPMGRPELLPPPAGGDPELPFEETGERSERPSAGSGGGDGAANDGGFPCEGCSAISADAPGVTPPVAIETAAPAYPELARRAHTEGVVVLEAVIGADGAVRDVHVKRGVSPLLDPAALEAVKRWRYHPASIDGRPVAVYLQVVLTFSLRNL